jgi:Holliday junction resolvase RusA-like endonuclease
MEGLKRKVRLEGYNLYKKRLAAAALDREFDFLLQYFEVPTGMYMQVKFFIPVPKAWRLWKKTQMHLKQHQSQPDFDNFIKALCDSLITKEKRADKSIADIRITKLWFYDPEQHTPEHRKDKGYRPSGWIEFWLRPDAN